VSSILSIKAFSIGGGIQCDVTIKPEFVEQYFCVFVNGIYIKYVYADKESFSFVIVGPPNNATNTIWIEEAGTSVPDESTIATLQAHAVTTDADTADHLKFLWTANFTGPEIWEGGATPQISSVALTGLSRGLNCQVQNQTPQRGTLFYTIEKTLQ
jgi:hypothetical protein